MKKNLLLILILLGALSLPAQINPETDYLFGKKEPNMKAPNGFQVSTRESPSGATTYLVHKEIQNQPSKTKKNYHLKINIEGMWDQLSIGNGDDFFDLFVGYVDGQTSYETDLPEGLYDIVIEGSTDVGSHPNHIHAPVFYFFEQVDILTDTVLTAIMSDVHKIDVIPVDTNNNTPDCAFKSTSYILDMIPSLRTLFIIEHHHRSWIPCFINDVGSRNKLSIMVDGYDVVNQNTYFISELVPEHVTEDLILHNKVEELVYFTQFYNVSKNIAPTSNLRKLLVIHDGTEVPIYLSFTLDNRPHDKEKPYSLFTNHRFNENLEQGINVFLQSEFYESDDFYVSSSPMAINKDNELIIDFFPMYSYASNVICNNSLSRVYNKNEFYYEGYRTPFLRHSAYNLIPQNNPMGKRCLDNWLTYLGEYNESKYIHGNVNVTFTGDDKIVFKGSMNLFNINNIKFDASHSKYQIEVKNGEVFAYGQQMLNYTNIEFDMTKEDINPPTLTMLRIIDHEKISMSITDAATASLEIAAADYDIEFAEYDGLYYPFLFANKKPNLEVSFSIDGETFHELAVVEDPSKFYKLSGNFFNVSLQPILDFGVDSGWIIIKTILTDEVGNRQTQIFQPLFHVGAINLGVADHLPGEQAKMAYPNPFHDKVTIELENPLSGEVYFEVYDMTGKIIHQKKYNCNQTSTFQWNGSHVTAGVYFYGIYSKDGIVKGKLIKQ